MSVISKAIKSVPASFKLDAGEVNEIAHAIATALESKWICNYCGHMYKSRSNTGFCLECIDQEDLEESQLFMLYLLPLAADVKLTKRSIKVPQWLTDVYRLYRPVHTMGSHIRT